MILYFSALDKTPFFSFNVTELNAFINNRTCRNSKQKFQKVIDMKRKKIIHLNLGFHKRIKR
jgi:hypothetical protein